MLAIARAYLGPVVRSVYCVRASALPAPGLFFCASYSAGLSLPLAARGGGSAGTVSSCIGS